jgi:uncharacterized protein YjdB
MSLSYNLPVNQSVMLNSQVLDQNSQPYTPPNPFNNFVNPQYSSSNTAIATVSNGPGSNTGVVKGISAGSANILVNYTDPNGNIAATTTIAFTVYNPIASTIYVALPNQDV